jgi:uncharacterized protein
MALFDKINDDLKSAMLSKDQGALRAVRAIKAALLLMKTESGDKEISPEEEIKMIQKLIKQRKESIEVYQKQNRPDLAQLENEELVVIEKYLPQQLSLEEVKKEVLDVIKEIGAGSIADLGKVMPVAMKKLAGKSDGKTISEIVKQMLGSL